MGRRDSHWFGFKNENVITLCSFSSFQTPADTYSNYTERRRLAPEYMGSNTHTHTPTHTADDSYKYPRTRVRSDSYTIFHLNRHTPSGQSRVYRVTQLRTDVVRCRETTGTGPVNLKVVPVTGVALAGPTNQIICASLSHTHCWYEVGTLYCIV